MSEQRETEFDNLELIDPEIRRRAAEWMGRVARRILRDRRAAKEAQGERSA